MDRPTDPPDDRSEVPEGQDGGGRQADLDRDQAIADLSQAVADRARAARLAGDARPADHRGDDQPEA